MKYDAIVIDTSIYQRYGFKFEQGLLKTLEQFSRKPATLLIPEIVAREVIGHIAKKTNEAALQLERAIHSFDEEVGLPKDKIHPNIYPSLGEDTAKRKLAKFTKKTGAVIIKTDGLLNVQKLIDCYFNNEPPFTATGKKKSEFPDAITLIALEEYANRNNIKILAVSADSDWKEYISNCERMSHSEDLAQAISEFQPQAALFETCAELSKTFSEDDGYFLAELKTEISKILSQQKFSYETYSEFTWEPQLLALEVTGLEFFGKSEAATFYPVSKIGEKLTVETKVIISAKAIGEFSLFLYDFAGWGANPNQPIGGARQEQDLKILASVTFTTSQAGLEIFGPNFDNLEISLDPIHVNFGALEPIQLE